ncbi:hypothetical protein [Pseudomonas sp. TH34]|uniref:hypothetical protein n=1 Tax=Pseudomonas sp. TH34 TaxID=2796399 RepID=UPI00313BB0B4
MIQRPASGTFDLELCKPTRTGEKSVAVTASYFFQHLQIPFAESPFPWAIKNPAHGGAFWDKPDYSSDSLTHSNGKEESR